MSDKKRSKVAQELIERANNQILNCSSKDGREAIANFIEHYLMDHNLYKGFNYIKADGSRYNFGSGGDTIEGIDESYRFYY